MLPEADGEGVALAVTVREMPPILVFPSFIYTEENGFSYGGALSALNLTGRGISLSARAYFGGTTQRWGRFSNPWIRGNHLSFEFFGGKRDRADTLNGFEEDSWEFTPRVGTWLGKPRPAARVACRSSRCSSDVAGRPWTRTTRTISCGGASSGTTRAIRGATPGTAGRASSSSSAAEATAPSGR